MANIHTTNDYIQFKVMDHSRIAKKKKKSRETRFIHTVVIGMNLKWFVVNSILIACPFDATSFWFWYFHHIVHHSQQQAVNSVTHTHTHSNARTVCLFFFGFLLVRSCMNMCLLCHR